MKQEKSEPFERSETEQLISPSFFHSSENLAYNISSVNVSGGPVTISAGQMLLLLKKFSNHPVNTITGSIQKYESTINLVAWTGGHKVEAWDVRKDILSKNLTRDGSDIPYLNKNIEILDMVRELAFRIAKDISIPEIAAKTWMGLKLYTEALDEFNQYKEVKSDVRRLKRSKDLCIEAINAERDYEEPYKLLFDLGREYDNIGDYINAEQAFRDVIKIKKDAKLFLGLGNVLYHRDEFDEAIDVYDKAIRLKPRDTAAWSNKGRALDSKGNKHGENQQASEAMNAFDEAIKAFDEAVRLDPNNAIALSNKSYALNRRGEFLKNKSEYNKAIKAHEEAIKVCDEAIIWLDPDFSAPWINKGYALKCKGNNLTILKYYDKAISAYKKAVKVYEQTIRIDHDNASTWQNKGDALKDKGDTFKILENNYEATKAYEEAIKAYEQTIEIDPRNPISWGRKGLALKMLGRKPKPRQPSISEVTQWYERTQQ